MHFQYSQWVNHGGSHEEHLWPIINMSIDQSNEKLHSIISPHVLNLLFWMFQEVNYHLPSLLVIVLCRMLVQFSRAFFCFELAEVKQLADVWSGASM